MPASASSTPVTNVPLPRWARNGTSPSMRCADESNTTPDVQSNVSTARPTNRTFTTLPGGGGPVVGDPPALPGTVISFTTAPSPVRSSPSGSSCRGVRSSMAFANSLPLPKGPSARAERATRSRSRSRDPKLHALACRRAEQVCTKTEVQQRPGFPVCSVLAPGILFAFFSLRRIFEKPRSPLLLKQFLCMSQNTKVCEIRNERKGEIL